MVRGATSTSNYRPVLTAHMPGGDSINVYNFYPGVKERIEKATAYLRGLDPVPASRYEIIVSAVEVEELEYVQDGNGAYTAQLKVNLNAGCDENDDIIITVTNLENGEEVTVPVTSKTSYEVEIAAEFGDRIEVEVSGMQNTEGGVYFFQPQATDADGDGVATTRETSQNLVGFGAGEIPVGDSVVLRMVDMELKKVDTCM